MKTKTLSILLALVAILSMSVGVFAADFTETWDEETVLTVFNDMDIVFPDLFADIDSDFLWVESDTNEVPTFDKALSLEDVELEAKAPVKDNVYEAKAEYEPCGDGLIKVEITMTRDEDYIADSSNYSGPKKLTYIRNIYADDGAGSSFEIAKCTSAGGDNCRSVRFDSKGKAKLTLYLYNNSTLTPARVYFRIELSRYMTALFSLPYDSEVNGYADVVEKTKKNYCQATLNEYDPKTGVPGSMKSVRARYDQNTGEARFQATIVNKEGLKNPNYVIPGEIIALGSHIKDYTCKYTLYNNANGAPRTDYCKYGEGIALSPNALIRFDITVDHLPIHDTDGNDIDFWFRVGGLNYFINGTYKAVDFPCPVVSRMQVMDPLMPFMTFYGIDQLLNDKAIEPSGAYGVYEGGLWGIYQKCGKYAYMAVRLKNDGVKDEVINLDHVAVAVNGGTPMSWNWVLSTVDADGSKIELEAGEDVILIGRAKVTDVPSQLNADTAMTGAVNFTDYGFYITGKVYSDHNNTNCVAAPK